MVCFSLLSFTGALSGMPSQPPSVRGNTYLSISPGLDQFNESKSTFSQDPDRGEVFSQSLHIESSRC